MKRILGAIVAVCLILTMVPAVLAVTPFTDVTADQWYYSDVENAYDMGLINGKTATEFAPQDNLTYAEAVKLAACMHQRYTTGAVTLTNGTPWYQTYVDYCKDNGIITKDYPWEFNASRAGYMEIFANALPEEALTEVNFIAEDSIPDVSSMHPQASSIYKLYRAGILQGNDAEHNCNPSASIMRSEVAAILTRMMEPSERISFTMGDPDEIDEKDEEKDEDKDDEKEEEKDDKEEETVKPDPKPDPKPDNGNSNDDDDDDDELPPGYGDPYWEGLGENMTPIF